MRSAEQAAFGRAVSVEALMDRAGKGVARTVEKFFAHPGKCLVYAGKGHNAGDAFVAATELQLRGWSVDLHSAFAEAECSELTQKKLNALLNTPTANPVNGAGPVIILDGLLGTGATAQLREPI